MLVYAGAVIVLFVFIIMLIRVEDKKKAEKTPALSFVAGLLVFLLLASAVYGVCTHFPSAPLPTTEGFYVTLKDMGYCLLTKYMLPVQLIGCLLLIAMIGVVVISKPYLSHSEASEQPSEINK